jgi:hypothetical protein
MHCTICVYAFSVDSALRPKHKDSPSDGCNSLHIRPAQNDIASLAICRRVNTSGQKKIKDAELSLSFAFVSVDGDEGHHRYSRTALR